MRMVARVLQIVCVIGFLVDLGVFCYLLLQQDPYMSNPALSNLWMSHYWSMVSGAFLLWPILLGGVGASGIWLRRLNRLSALPMTPVADETTVWPPPPTEVAQPETLVTGPRPLPSFLYGVTGVLYGVGFALLIVCGTLSIINWLLNH